MVKSSLTKLMIIGLLLCMVYYAYACVFSYGRLVHSVSMQNEILFGAGFAGVVVSVMLLMPFSKGVKKGLCFLLGVNGAISAVAWILLSQHIVTLFFFMFGLAQFFYFSCFSLSDREEVNSKGQDM